MSDIAFIRRHALSLPNARALVDKIADQLAAEHRLRSEWHGNTLRFERPGIQGQIHVAESKVRLDVTLGILLKPLKAAFVGHIERNFDKYLPEPRPETLAKKKAKKAGHRAA